MTTILPLYNRQSKLDPIPRNVTGHFVVLTVLAVLCSPLFGISQMSFAEKLRQQIDKTIAFETTVDYELTPGFIVGIVDGNNSIVLSFGTKDVMSEDTISVDDIFELGSVTKVFTAALIAEMHELGQISLSTCFDSLLPDMYHNPALAELTIQDLLTHHSGLPRYPPFESEITNPLTSLESYALEDILDFYHRFKPKSNGEFLYSNVGYAMMEPILYSRTSKRFNELLDEFLFDKNGMTSTTLASADVTVKGYDLAMNEISPVDFGVFNSSGGLKSNMKDLLRFITYALSDSPDILWSQHGSGLGKHLGIGLGWHIVHQRHFSPIYTHAGRGSGHTAFVGLVPQTTTGVVILANSANGVDDLGMEILRMINKNWKRKN